MQPASDARLPFCTKTKLIKGLGLSSKLHSKNTHQNLASMDPSARFQFLAISYRQSQEQGLREMSTKGIARDINAEYGVQDGPLD
jgi:hypothetical protein